MQSIRVVAELFGINVFPGKRGNCRRAPMQPLLRMSQKPFWLSDTLWSKNRGSRAYRHIATARVGSVVLRHSPKCKLGFRLAVSAPNPSGRGPFCSFLCRSSLKCFNICHSSLRGLNKNASRRRPFLYVDTPMPEVIAASPALVYEPPSPCGRQVYQTERSE
jgi:hypothetical protein